MSMDNSMVQDMLSNYKEQVKDLDNLCKILTDKITDLENTCFHLESRIESLENVHLLSSIHNS